MYSYHLKDAIFSFNDFILETVGEANLTFFAIVHQMFDTTESTGKLSTISASGEPNSLVRMCNYELFFVDKLQQFSEQFNQFRMIFQNQIAL